MDAGRRRLTQVDLLPVRIEGVATPKPAGHDVLRLCRNERDAVLVSIRLSKLSQAEIAARCGVSKQAVSKWLEQGIPGARVRAFCGATGTTLLAQYHVMQRAMREATGADRERDRIEHIVRLAAA